ncbi:hypothetical protein ACQP2F_36240 [Actinoplanes sp. CA-030573]|uniref:hypothetical protein n=1 Tax=Actinoplanes sp. CA-030573 TaxID=3239898 RepID=UPI003D940A3D
MKTSTRYGLGAFLSLIGALAAYVYAILAGHFYDLRPADEFCTGKTLASRPLEWSLFPPSQRCRWSDGTTSNLVPWYLNVLLFGLLGLAAVLTVLAIRARLRPLRTKSETTT